MKRLISTLILVFFCSLSYGQARLGSTATQIKDEFWESEYNLKSGYTEDDNIYYIKIQPERATVFYYFDQEKICVLCIITPDNQGALNFYVERYNRQYVIESSTEWKMYSKNGIADIELTYPDDGGYFFVWTDSN